MYILLRLELMKLAKWPTTWVLVGLLLGGVAVGDLVEVLNLHQVTPDVHATLVQNLTLPGAIVVTLKVASVIAAVAAAILAAAATGGEYGWGTLRPMLLTGVSRPRFLLAKLLSLVIAGCTFVLLPLAMNVLIALPAAIALHRPWIAGTVDGAWFSALGAMIGRTLLVVLVPLLVAFFFGIAGRSPVVGIGTALGLIIGDQILQLLFEGLGVHWAHTAENLLLGQLSHTLVHYNTFTQAVLPAGSVSQSYAIVVLVLYGMTCFAAAFALFWRRDVQGSGS